MTEQVKISRSAVASLVLGLLFLFPLIPAVLAIILGIVARRHIHSNESRYRGKGLATAGIILGVIQGIFWVFLLFSGSLYVVGPDEVAVITRFGVIQKKVNPGLNFKMPLIDEVNRINIRVYFEWQSTALQYVTLDGQRVTLRAKMRYRICNPVRYIQTTGVLADEKLMARKLEDIFYADIMNEANKHPLNDFVLSVRNLSLQKTLHSNFSTKLNLLGICMHKVDEPYEVFETSLK